MTFWTYAALCEHWPTFKEFKARVIGFASREDLDIGPLDGNFEERLIELHECKLANISQGNYIKVIKLVFEDQEFLERMSAISLTKGRERRGD